MNYRTSKEIDQDYGYLIAEAIGTVNKHLQPLGRSFNKNDEDPLEFFSFSNIDQAEIETLHKDGILVGAFENLISADLQQAFNEGAITLGDIISILSDLEGFIAELPITPTPTVPSSFVGRRIQIGAFDDILKHQEG